jgi:serine/threonine protein kinase
MNARLTGDPPAPRKSNPELSPQIEEIILHAMERDPAKRYQSAAEMKSELESPESVNVTGRAQRLRRASPWKRRFRHVRLYVIAGSLPVIAFLLLWLILSRQSR